MTPGDVATFEVAVHIDADTWARIYAAARENHQATGDAEMAYWDAVTEHITTLPTLVVDGETKGLEDIDGLPGGGR